MKRDGGMDMQQADALFGVCREDSTSEQMSERTYFSGTTAEDQAMKGRQLFNYFIMRFLKDGSFAKVARIAELEMANANSIPM